MRFFISKNLLILGGAMLSNRQINILAYLFNKEGWITSEILSSRFNLNKKTIQIEIRNISYILGNECNILINKHSGYLLEYLSDSGKKLISDEIVHFGGKNSLKFKPSVFGLYFLFLKSYVTMQELADTFYMSKSSVSLELSTVKRWLKRYDGMEMEVSNKNGIVVHATEIRKRIYCAKFGTINVFRNMPFQKEIVDKYENYLYIVENILLEVFEKYNYLIVGEEYNKISRFLAISVIRSEMGYFRGEEREFSGSPIVTTISSLIKEKIDYNLEASELYDLERILDESSLLSVNNVDNPELEERLQLLSDRISSILKIEDLNLLKQKDIIIQQLIKIKIRLESKNIALNHHHEDIVINYPLEAHLINRLLPKYFDIEVTKELSFITLFLATELNEYKKKSILLVTNQNIIVINHIETFIRKNLMGNIGEIKVIPVHIFKQNSNFISKYDILLTTEQEILFFDKKFHLIDCVLTNRNLKELNTVFYEILDFAMTTKRTEIRSKYLKEYFLKKEYSKLLTVNQIIGCLHDEFLSYHTFGNDKIYIVNISNLVETSIKIYNLDFTVDFSNKKISKIIFVQFKENEENIFDFFCTFSEILVKNM